ncbi:hypothetical protein GQX73_g3908 [Xylaria multiplex]|uniref:Uncharacterized protein n=1 Tax=Xylaria multiplex TaxID=323545 RepID=A0A7C8MVU9_9PEZI|nr:hypothetical protein GQX73_g3908 [Xylaria multiplex]
MRIYQGAAPSIQGSSSRETITTNNIHQVLEYFDNDGNLISPFNPRFHGPNEVREHYAVLPRCGHAFGYQCLLHVLVTAFPFPPSCPRCSKPVFPNQGPAIPLTIYDVTADLDSQRKQIRSIRGNLDPPQPEEPPVREYTGAERISIAALTEYQHSSRQTVQSRFSDTRISIAALTQHQHSSRQMVQSRFSDEELQGIDMFMRPDEHRG